MAQKAKTVFVCSSCGYESGKWYGQCPGCKEWNTLNEEFRASVAPTKAARVLGERRSPVYTISEISADTEHRFDTGLKELNRVLGGGLVKGSLVLLSGDPGIGKSTLLLQICEHLGQGLRILYVSGEESAHQLKLRATRLGVSSDKLYILCETDAQYIAEVIASEKPDVVMIDSIQTMSISELTSSAGSVTPGSRNDKPIYANGKNIEYPRHFGRSCQQGR